MYRAAGELSAASPPAAPKSSRWTRRVNSTAVENFPASAFAVGGMLEAVGLGWSPGSDTCGVLSVVGAVATPPVEQPASRRAISPAPTRWTTGEALPNMGADLLRLLCARHSHHGVQAPLLPWTGTRGR